MLLLFTNKIKKNLFHNSENTWFCSFKFLFLYYVCLVLLVVIKLSGIFIIIRNKDIIILLEKSLTSSVQL